MPSSLPSPISRRSHASGSSLITLIALALVVLPLAACATGGRNHGPHGGAGRGGALANFAEPQTFKRALELKSRDRCGEAVTILRPIAGFGGGFEVAQFQLADCLFTLASQESSGPKKSLLLAEALSWSLKAGYAGNASAQGLLADAYLHGKGVAPDPIEAGKWLILFEKSREIRPFGTPAPAPEVADEIRARLSESEWAEAQRRAKSFTLIAQVPAAPAESFAARAGNAPEVRDVHDMDRRRPSPEAS